MKKETKIFYDKVNFINSQLSALLKDTMVELLSTHIDIEKIYNDTMERLDEISACIGSLNPTTLAQTNRKKALVYRLKDTRYQIISVLSEIDSRGKI